MESGSLNAGSRMLRALPNTITVLRMVLVGVWGCLAEWSRQRYDAGAPLDPPRVWAVVVLLAIGVSDLVDGWLARRWHLQTQLGATLDAVADKLAQVVLLTFFAFRGPPAYAPIPLWFLLLVFGRDLLLLAGCLGVRHRAGSVDVVHRAHGRFASVLLFALLVWINVGGGDSVVRVAVPLFAAVVALSTIAYVRDGWRQFTGAPPGASSASPHPGETSRRG
ncbi:MAG: CDP-alcohol phosphatidyltransferase family protein [Planctomycetota bacterium]